MRKGLLLIITLISTCVLFSGCIKKTETLTINPYLTATINGVDTFTAATVVPSTADTQVIDTATALIITANVSDQFSFTDKIILEVTDYKGAAGVFSIIKSQAGGAYVHEGVTDYAANGIVAITQITSTSIIGYFSFTTVGGTSITNGTFSVGKP